MCSRGGVVGESRGYKGRWGGAGPPNKETVSGWTELTFRERER